MDKYHIYEEIGKGEYSQVFKGREKKKIEYVAIKRIEKSVMDRTVSEVQILHKLNNTHIIRFYDWYETRNNLWLILEYCTGADLQSILNQDEHLPESSIKIFGLDMISALKYLHSLGIIHGDLRPKNFLVDEYGILKISDFKYAQKIPKDVANNKSVELRGYPPYMPPELFTPSGVSSFQSDFWGLGCLLYELRRGFSPFGEISRLSLAELIEKINNVDPIYHPVVDPHTPSDKIGQKEMKKIMNNGIPSLSAEFADLLMWMLEKSPLDRIQWEEIVVHPFWNPNKPSMPPNLPIQEAYESYLRNLERERYTKLEAESNLFAGLSPSKSKTGSGNNENLIGNTPLKLPRSESTPLRPQFTSAKRLDNSNGSKSSGESNSGIDNLASQLPGSMFRHSETKQSRKNIEDEPSSSKNTNQRYFALFKVKNLISHSSEHQVKPIVGNKSIEPPDSIDYNASSLPFKPLSNEGIQKISQTDLEIHLTQVYKCLHKLAIASQFNNANPSPTIANSNALIERVNVLAYLCNISICAEVSNVILNTHFLNLILKLIKSNPNFSNSSTPSRSNQSSYSNLVQNASSASQLSRYHAVCLLAIMLRYTTYIQPPAIRSRDDHIVGTLVTILKENVRMDVKFKRKVVAALGEIIFYISAQDDDPEAEEPESTSRPNSAAEQWNLPSIAVEVVAKCLKDSSDEIIRHYAAKTIENVLTQGAFEFKKKFVSFEIAFRLFELSSQSSSSSQKNTPTGDSMALQTTCSMALYHLFSLIMSHARDSSFQDSDHQSIKHEAKFGLINNQFNSSPSRSPGTGGTTGSNLIFSNPVLGAKLIARVLDKGGLSTFIDILKEGHPKIQQAYINILLIIFTISHESNQIIQRIESDKSNYDSPSKRPSQFSNQNISELPFSSIPSPHAMSNIMKPITSFFLKSPLALSIVLKILEQGSNSVIKGKAILLIQMFCIHRPSFLETIAERKFSTILLRILDPALQRMSSQATPVSPNELSYLIKSTLSMLIFIKELCIEYFQNFNRSIIGLLNPHAEILTSGDPHQETPEKGSPAKTSPKSNKGDSDSSSLRVDLAHLRAIAETLSAAISICSPPLIRTLLFVSDPTLIHLSSATLKELIRVKKLGKDYSTRFNSDSFHNQLLETILSIEKTSILLLETISQIEVNDQIVVNSQFQGVSFPSQLLDVTMINFFLNKESATRLGWESFLMSAIDEFLPMMCQMLSQSDGNLRVIIIASLRKLLPQVLRSLFGNSESNPNHLDSELYNKSTKIIDQLLSIFPSLLTDKSPIPQYTVRLVYDMITMVEPLGHVIISLLVKYNILDTLLSLFGSNKPDFSSNLAAEDDGNEPTFANDPQLVYLIRLIFDFPDFSGLVVDSEISSSLSLNFVSFVYSEMNSFEQLNVHLNLEYIVALSELSHQILLFVIRHVTAQNSNTSSHAKRTQSEKYRHAIAPLRNISPALLMVMNFVCVSLDAEFAGDKMDFSLNDGLISTFTHLIDSCSRCMGMIFDLFPESSTHQLLSKNSLLNDSFANQLVRINRPPNLKNTPNYEQFDLISNPRSILSRTLNNANILPKVRQRVLKLLIGVAKVAASVGLSSPAKDMIMSTPLFDSLIHYAAMRTTQKGNENTKDAVEEAYSLTQYSKQLIESAQKL